MRPGEKGEILARGYLTSQGLELLEANFRLRFGEVDLIMLDQDTLVFVEVKYRSSEAYGTSLEQVTVSKQKKIKLVAAAYLQRYPQEVSSVRFDVVGISPDSIGYQYKWVKGAFE